MKSSIVPHRVVATKGHDDPVSGGPDNKQHLDNRLYTSLTNTAWPEELDSLPLHYPSMSRMWEVDPETRAKVRRPAEPLIPWTRR